MSTILGTPKARTQRSTSAADRRRLATSVGAVTAAAFVACLALPSVAAAAPRATGSAPYALFTGYADCPSLTTCNASTVTNPNFPQPWFGATGLAFVGDPSVYDLTKDTDPDTSAIRIANTTTASITVDDLSVSTCSGGTFDPWGTSPLAYPYTIAPGTSTVFTSTNGDNFDGSEICNVMPTVTVDVNGVSASYSDSVANVGHGAIPGGGGTPFGDESTPWTKLTSTKGPITVVPKKLSKATVGTAYDGLFAAQGSNGAPIFKLKSGTLPPGLKLQADSAYHSAADVTGTPTKAGKYIFTIGVADSNTPKKDKGSKTFTFKVVNPSP
jgi:hypothetical protein